MNKAKTPLFSVEERVKMLKEVTKDLGNVKVVPFDGLLVEFARQQKARLVIRGLRAITDFEYELQMSQTNHTLETEVETMFLTTNLKYSYLSFFQTKLQTKHIKNQKSQERGSIDSRSVTRRRVQNYEQPY